MAGKLTEACFDAFDFARRIRIRIAERGISQADCASETGISKSTISRICALKKSPDVENYLRLVKWLDAALEREKRG